MWRHALTETAPVLGQHNRQFKAVFEEAQIQLRYTFGMEMTELPLKEKVTITQRRGQYGPLSRSGYGHIN